MKFSNVRHAMCVCMLAILSANVSAAQTAFQHVSSPTTWQSIYRSVDDPTMTITVSGSPEAACVNTDEGSAGRWRLHVEDDGRYPAVCIASMILTFETSGFDIDQISFSGIDDFDASDTRDVADIDQPGSWTPLGGTLTVGSLASPPAGFNAINNLIASGGQGDFLYGTINNPVGDAARFDFVSPTSTFNFVYDDAIENGAEGRGALTRIDLDGMIIRIVTITPIAAVDDAPAPVSGAVESVLANIVANDSLNGATDPALGTAVTLTTAALAGDGSALGLVSAPAAGAITLDAATGTLTVAAGTTAGSYDYRYEICETVNPGNCAVATARVVVTAPAIAAVDDDLTPLVVNSAIGGEIGTVLDNDTIGGRPVAKDGSDTFIVVMADGGIAGVTIRDDGTISIPKGTAQGDYTLEYRLCSELNPAVCDTALLNIKVLEPSLLDEIETDLIAILAEDRSIAIENQMRAADGFAKDALQRLRKRSGSQCQAAIAGRLAEENILFAPDSTVILQASFDTLDDIARILDSCLGTRFEIAGHTDSDASEAYNLDLSQRRVEAVMRALDARNVNTRGFVARGYGESRPVASKATAAGKAKNRRVEFVLLDGSAIDQPCHDTDRLERSFDLSENNTDITADGSVLSRRHHCGSGITSTFEGYFNVFESAKGLSHKQLNLSYRRDRFVGENAISGFFVGLYGSQNSVGGRADGEISGLGVNAGVYGARGFDNGLFVDYFLGVAAGRHEFDLDFARTLGTINAKGNYTYFAGFAGIGLSGTVDFETYSLSPRVGINYAYSPSADVDVVTSLGAIQQSDIAQLGSLSSTRLFAELRFETGVNAGASMFAFTPRISCYSELAGSGKACTGGASIEFASTDKNADLTYSFGLDGDFGRDFSASTVSASVSRRLQNGRFRADLGRSGNGSLILGSSLELEF
ncbi:OmpA family protein [Antarctobacter jejuensis]|uniref:OmpA family protein n=1 Tax=Antarctobacter jejuensis TaxID=1439938 RepID=UPI003FCFC86A